ncbi:alpha-glucuronidase [Klebsiella grimontii]|uniref:alpha-glucuronidase n=1 Tax=Klebsiella grimontii TaxID=2058152 RepID=UPI00292A9C54|nr:alpha-glucuronidase [Klebsiella grimontii]MDV1015278.1 alpha-glucuronidase [Klebsiella grimontii]MDV1025987.1 alpha-glucuronidase [Klebsiella grimontii]MDV1042486.1 alpha-glucuronidase [Klebsiella grimontii]MDV1106960.1 alpha-glucuronidase [Klebsiella grimontii]MDV1117273.1 alpha-glucuronidase [Klebsiella grimontii]
MQPIINDNLPRNYQKCWLPSSTDIPWLIRYLDNVYLPEGEDIIKSTLINEITALNHNIKNSKSLQEASLSFVLDENNMVSEQYSIDYQNDTIRIVSGGWQGFLYAWFDLLRKASSVLNSPWQSTQKPAFPVRMINHWDNLDGTVERGYAGNSLFFHNNQIHYDEIRLHHYARLLASVGINAIAINNVNVHHHETALIDDSLLPSVAQIAAIFRQYAIRLFLSVNFAAPIETGELSVADPLDPQVIDWWQTRAEKIYQQIADFGGYIVKADSEHRPGPFTYQRTHADGANMLARTLAPYDGLLYWRCFVYNCQQQWYDRTTDRAKAAWDNFAPLDGQFLDNVILQIKNGPMDFQVREPVSPLLGSMPNTNKVMELQITQEYTGQQIDLCWLVPQWKTILNFDTRPGERDATILDILAGHSQHHMQHSGITAVVNTGDSVFWAGHPLAQANLYGYGRLLWDPLIDEKSLAEEWCKLSLSTAPKAVETISQMLLSSWLTYENYTSPLGVGWMVQPHHHYGPSIDGYEYDSWGTYHYADRYGLGVDRTSDSGTGYVKQYHPLNCQMYNNPGRCPQELLLFFHHLQYRHVLPSGKTLIQHIYDSHFSGVNQVELYIQQWKTLEGDITEDIYSEVLQRLVKQLANAQAWRDQINTYFYRKSGIKDSRNRNIYP